MFIFLAGIEKKSTWGKRKHVIVNIYFKVIMVEHNDLHFFVCPKIFHIAYANQISGQWKYFEFTTWVRCLDLWNSSNCKLQVIRLLLLQQLLLKLTTTTTTTTANYNYSHLLQQQQMTTTTTRKKKIPFTRYGVNWLESTDENFFSAPKVKNWNVHKYVGDNTTSRINCGFFVPRQTW